MNTFNRNHKVLFTVIVFFVIAGGLYVVTQKSRSYPGSLSKNEVNGVEQDEAAQLQREKETEFFQKYEKQKNK